MGFFLEELSEFFVVLVGLVEGVAGVCQDHVDKFLIERSVEVQFEVLSEILVGPQSGKYFIGVLSVLELLVELVRPASVGNPAVKSYQAKGKVLAYHFAGPQLFVHYLGLGVVQEVKYHLDVLGRDVRVGDDVLLAQQEGRQL